MIVEKSNFQSKVKNKWVTNGNLKESQCIFINTWDSKKENKETSLI